MSYSSQLKKIYKLVRFETDMPAYQSDVLPTELNEFHQGHLQIKYLYPFFVSRVFVARIQEKMSSSIIIDNLIITTSTINFQ